MPWQCKFISVAIITAVLKECEAHKHIAHKNEDVEQGDTNEPITADCEVCSVILFTLWVWKKNGS